MFAFRFDDFILCVFPEGVATIPFGAFPAGDYQVTIDVVWPGPFGVAMSETLGVVPMHVGGVAVNPAPVPTLSMAGLLGLIAVFCMAGLVTLLLRLPPGMRRLAAKASSAERMTRIGVLIVGAGMGTDPLLITTGTTPKVAVCGVPCRP
jgi:hypothetical protein